jgi:hypothetical protein
MEDQGSAAVGHLYEMLEGQVAILSSGMLSSAESLSLLDSLRNSKLYRADQHSYILYPDRNLPGFLEKNSMTPDQVNELKLVSELVKANDKTLIVRDEEGNYHFSGHIRNLKDVTRTLNSLKNQYSEFVESDAEKIKVLFEHTFQHTEFTGRSGTFFAYEGLGSIYWHMVSKLLLAVQETILRTRNETSTAALIETYADIRRGVCFNKSPGIYGAFPTDPYSHTPKGQGAKQPGMTGMVKEEILTRQMELGFSIEEGKIVFDFLLFERHIDNPILTAQDWPYPAHTVFNAGACQVGDETILLVRVEDRRGHSHLAVARSNDGVTNWHVDSKPSFAPDPTNFPEEAWGVEDPRLTWVEERQEWIIAYTAFSPSGLSLDAPAHEYHRALMAELTAGRHERLGDAILAAQQRYAGTGLMPELMSIYHLLGDPAMPIR